jgi:hypothetical protein
LAFVNVKPLRLGAGTFARFVGALYTAMCNHANGCDASVVPELHVTDLVNFRRPTDQWREDYRELFAEMADVLSPSVKEQLAAEIIFLTHNDKLHETNLGWHPKGEEYLWKPELQETKYSETGGRNLRYKRGFKAELGQSFCGLLNQFFPECRIRYAF